MLKEITNFHVGSVTAVQNPLRENDDLLDDKLGELYQSSVLIFFSGTPFSKTTNYFVFLFVKASLIII